MKKSPNLKPSKYDALVALTVLLLAIALGACYWFAPAQTGPEIVVFADGAEIDRLPFGNTERIYTNNGYTVHVVVTPDGVQVADANCPTQVCVHTGSISRAGENIICLPSRIVITVEDAADSGFDTIAG